MRHARLMLSRGEVSERDDVPSLVVPGYEVFAQRGSPLQWHGRRVGDGRNVTLICLPTQGWEARTRQQAVNVTAALSRVHHRHLLGLYDVIPDVRGPHGDVFLVIVTARIGDGSLMTTLAERGRLSAAEAVTVLIPIGQALAAMHEGGHVHGWLRAEVVVFTADGMPLLAPSWMDTTQWVGESGGGDGSIAPEVVEGFQATLESDCYGYAALIWSTLTGGRPGSGVTRGELEELAPASSPALSRAVSRALSPDSSQRPPLEELLGCLQGLARPEPIEMGAADVAGGVPSQIRARARTAALRPGRREPSRPRHRQPRSWARAAVTAMALIMLLTSGAIALMQMDSVTFGREMTSKVTHGALPKALETDGGLRGHPVDGVSGERRLSIVQDLLDARAEAWVSGDVERLAQAHAAGSPAMAADRERLLAAGATGDHLQGLRFTASRGVVAPSASAASLVPKPDAREQITSGDPASFAMLLTVHREATTVITEGGQETTVPATTDRVRVTVVRQGGVWRFYEWT